MEIRRLRGRKKKVIRRKIIEADGRKGMEFIVELTAESARRGKTRVHRNRNLGGIKRRQRETEDTGTFEEWGI